MSELSEQILTAAEIAKELRCSKSLVYRLLHGDVDGLTELRHIPLGRKKVVPRAVFEAWKVRNTSGKLPADSEGNAVDAVR